MIEFNFSKSILRNGCHYIDLMFFLVDKKFKDILKIHYIKNLNTIIIKFKKNFKTEFIFKLIDSKYHEDECSVYFENKKILIRNIEEEILIWKIKKRYLNSKNTYLKLKSVNKSKKFEIFKGVFHELNSTNSSKSSLITSLETMKFLKYLGFIKR